jgi:nucleoside 2-deoxyribosyltransferase
VLRNLIDRQIPLFRRNGAIGSEREVGEHGAVIGCKVYIAARYARRDELKDFARELQDAGASIACRWLYADGGALLDDDLSPQSRAGKLAAIDFEDVQSADICLAFTEPGENPSGRGGRHTELGIALALGRRVILIGPREHVFHCLPQIEHYETWEAARRSLGVGDSGGAEPMPTTRGTVPTGTSVSLPA